ncbi:M48 family metallopeptidase [Dechloromonas denitrificans]|uniref:M48 family metallopeptidase n=1 Tax=Dechloromonas denitrificans TaxID=281362 RepID=UPI001CF82D0D|nr:M48 family metallopeptidase [Dechloromonas denitrificans]UCV13039.1 M48 family metallopeptidase [Dechloromonas denitrificans]
MIRRLLPLLAAVSLLGCAGNGGGKIEIPLLDSPGSKAPIFTQLTPGKHEASIMAIGGDRDLARGQNGSHHTMGYINSKDIETYLNTIRNRFVAVSGVTDVPGKVKLTADLTHGAKATADGNIFIPITWLLDTESEDALAAVIAHELSHVLLKHQSTNIVGSIQKKLQSGHEMLLGLKMDVRKTTQLGKKDNKALLAAQVSVALVDNLIMPSWNRRQETEADLLAVDLMIRAGYTPDGMDDMLQTMKTSEEKQQKSRAAIETQLKELALQNPELAVKKALSTLIEDLSNTHPETEKRREAITDYRDKHYAEAPIPDYSSSAIKKLKAMRSVGPLLNNYRHTLKARNRLDEGNVQQAYSEALLGVKAPTAKDAIPNWILWKTAHAAGKDRLHQDALRNVLNNSEPIKAVYEEIITSEEQAGRHQIALNYVIKAQKVFGDDPEWTPHKIRLLSKLGRKDEAKLETAKCILDTPEQKHKCREAAKS